jgi:hypothetical protein
METLGFDLLYAFIIVRLARRDLVWINVTPHPTADWMAPMMASVELAITRETMLRSTPNCAPSIGKMKRRPMRFSIP